MSSQEKPNIVFRLLYFINILLCIAILGAYLNTYVSPNTIPYLAFLGLAYPLLILSLGAFCVFWLLTHRRYLIINAVVFLLGFNHFFNFYAYNNSSGVPNISAFKVMSYNVRIFNYYDVKEKFTTRDRIFKFLEQESADVICFQEFYHKENAKKFKTKDTLVNILEAKNHHERYTHEMTGKQYFGVVTFTKFPIVGKGEIGFENDDNNYCIYTDIKKNNDTIRIFNGHLGSIRLQDSDYAFFGDDAGKVYQREKKEQQILGRLKIAFEKRAIQIEKVMEQISSSPYPVVFCGDFNDTPISYCYKQADNELIDSFTESGNGVGTTYIGKIPSNRIDYIFHSPQLLGTNFVTHQVNYSDHKPISCYIDNATE
jgi:endonuclease/exonuclease/phosphatase family metal-dependent hydrolase